MVQIFSFFLFFLFSLHAEDEIEILLPTKSSLYPIYLSKVQNNVSSFDASYREKLGEILQWDLEKSGYFFLLPRENPKEALLQKEGKEVFLSSLWKDKKYAFILKPSINQKNFSLQVFHLSDQNFKRFADIPLSGILSLDRRKIHILVDSFLEIFLKKRGIAHSKILYTVRTPVSGEKKWISEVWICDADGANPFQLTKENYYCVHPLFFPSHAGEKSRDYLYVSYRTGQPKIYYSPLDQQNPIPLISLKGNQLLPALSKNFDSLAFICDAAGRPDLFVQKIDSKRQCIGKPIQLFSFPRATEASPSFSPSGASLAFVSDKDGSPRIYIMQMSETFHQKRPSLQLITKKNRINVTPAWSPDGTKLAYSAKVDKTYQIWIYDFETDEEWQLTKGPGNKENPSWAYDSFHLVFNTEDNPSELFIANLNQTEATKISSGGGRKRFPCWEPAYGR